MATYPIKMLKDEEGTPFVPLVSTDCIKNPDGNTLQDLLDEKLEPENIIAGDNVTVVTSGNNVTISTSGKGALIDNLNTTTAGEGGLDAHQGYVLKNMIPDVINDVTSTSTSDALSANQGYILNQKVVPTGGTAGQVLKKKTDSNYSLEWGDAADPNAVVGDGSIKKIVELTYEEYKALEDAGTVDPDTEYHVTDSLSVIDNLQETLDSLQSQITTLNSEKDIIENNLDITVKASNFKIAEAKGAKWMRVYYTNSQSGTTLWTGTTELKYSMNPDKWSILGYLSNYYNEEYGGYEFLLQYPGYTFNRWSQTSNPLTSSTVSGYKAITVNMTSNGWGGLAISSSTTDTLIDGSPSATTWYYSIGQLNTYNDGIPGDGTIVDSVQEVELWIRVG